jgi:hypothetical protein
MITAYPGEGLQMQYSTDGVHFMNVAQLRKFAPLGAKQLIVDQTNTLTPGNAAAPLAARFDAGEIWLDGVRQKKCRS